MNIAYLIPRCFNAAAASIFAPIAKSAKSLTTLFSHYMERLFSNPRQEAVCEKIREDVTYYKLDEFVNLPKQGPTGDRRIDEILLEGHFANMIKELQAAGK